MEIFNISEFNSHKISGEYNQVLNDGTLINQFEYSAGYIEKITPPNEWFYSYKEFYPNGQLKRKGELFKKGDFKSGIWYECDNQGKTLNEIDNDEPYKLSVTDVFNIIESRNIHFRVEDNFNKITRNIIDSKATWIVKWKVKNGRMERLYIDDATSKIVKQDYILFESDN
jgi:hypothetical protein